MVGLRKFIERYWLRAAVVLGLCAMDSLVFVMIANDFVYDGRTFGIPTSLRPFDDWMSDEINSLLLGLACCHVSLLTLWVLYGRWCPEVRWGVLLLGIAALSRLYGRLCPPPSVTVILVAQAVSLLVCVPLFRIGLFHPNPPTEVVRRKLQFSIRTLLLITTLVALGITIVSQVDLGILIGHPTLLSPAQRPLGAVAWPSTLDFLTTGRGPKVICVWKLLLGLCCTLSVLLSIWACRGSPWRVWYRLLIASATSILAVVTIIWLAVDHQTGPRFFYPPLNTKYTHYYSLAACYDLALPWIGWILVQILVVSGVLLALRLGAQRNVGPAS